MSFTYDAGTSTPNLAGLVEFNGIRINDGTFVCTHLGGIIDSSGLRSNITQLPSDHGGTAGTPFYDPRDILIEGYLTVPLLADVDGATDLLEQSFNLWAGLQTLTVNRAGWAAARQLTARVAGPIQIVEPDMLAKLVPDRDFTIPLVAPDPRLYAVTEQAVTVTAGTSLTNGGSIDTPFRVRFNGPLTNPQIDGPGAAGTNRIRFSGTVTSGHWVEVQTNPASSTGVSAYDDAGASAYGTGTYGSGVSAFTATTITPGSSSWTATADSGTGSTVVYFRDAWA